jgi:hypothetical protein
MLTACLGARDRAIASGRGVVTVPAKIGRIADQGMIFG